MASKTAKTSAAFGILCIICQYSGFALTSETLIVTSITCGCIGLLLGLAAIYSDRKGHWTAKLGIGLASISAFWWMFFFPQFRSVRESQLRTETCERFNAIALALHAFIADNKQKRLPPGSLRDKTGQPLLSWRVLVLPYLGRKDLYLKFKMDEPWDSEHNAKLLSCMPNIYAPPKEALAAREEYSTFCQVFVGPGTAFGCPDGCRFPQDFVSVSNTILLVEAGSAVPWTKPEDVSYSPIRPLPRLGALHDHETASLFFSVTKTFCIAWGDGRVTYMFFEDQNAAEQSLRAAITRDGKDIGDWYWR
jgi:hypothetical protein